MRPKEFANFNAQDHEDLLRCKYYTQYVAMRNMLQAGECPFCNLDPEKNKVLLEHSGWRAWVNPFPTKGTAVHVVMAPYEHKTDLGSLEPEDWRGIGYLLEVMSGGLLKGINLPGGGLLMRFGDPRLNAGTIRHLHMNVLVPNGSAEVRLPLFKADAEKLEEKERLVEIFQTLYELSDGSTEPSEEVMRSLSPAELQLLEGRMKKA